MWSNLSIIDLRAKAIGGEFLCKSTKNRFGILMGIALNLQIASSMMDFFTNSAKPKVWEIFSSSEVVFGFFLKILEVLIIQMFGISLVQLESHQDNLIVCDYGEGYNLPNFFSAHLVFEYVQSNDFFAWILYPASLLKTFSRLVLW